MKKHRCGMRHRTGRALAQCEWRGQKVVGKGQWFVESRCYGVWVFRMEPNFADALLAADENCGVSDCVGWHGVQNLEWLSPKSSRVEWHRVWFVNLVNQRLEFEAFPG